MQNFAITVGIVEIADDQPVGFCSTHASFY